MQNVDSLLYYQYLCNVNFVQSYMMDYIQYKTPKYKNMANVHGFNDINRNNPRNNNPIRQPMIGRNDQQQGSMDVMNQQIRQNKVPFMNNMVGTKPALEETIPYTLMLVWCPTLKLLSVTTFLLIAIWTLYIVCLTQGIDTSKGLVLAPTAETLRKFGAVAYSPLKNGEVWRLWTAAFLHVDLLHIVMNSISMLFFLSRLQKCYDSKLIGVLCLASALAGNITSVKFNDKNVISAGASTIIFGTLGGLLAYMTINWKTLGRIRSQLCCIVGIITFMSVIMSLGGAVDLAGHLGGMFGGYTCALAIFPGIRPKPKQFVMGGGAAYGIYVLVMLLVFYL